MKMPKILSTDELQIVKVIEGLSDSTKGQGVIAFVLSLTFNVGLGSVLAAVGNITLAVHMMIVHVQKSEFLLSVFEVILELVTFDILPVDVVYDSAFGEPEELPNEDLVAAGYESDSSVRNMGSVFVFFWLSIYILYNLWFLNKVLPEEHKSQLS